MTPGSVLASGGDGAAGQSARRLSNADRTARKQTAPCGAVCFCLLVETLLVLPSRLRLLAALHAGALIMLSLPNLSNHARLGAAALEPLQSTVDGLAVLHMDLRHSIFSLPPRHPAQSRML